MTKSIKNLSRATIIGGLLTFALGSTASGDVYTGWTNQRDYALNTAATGITTNVVNFPVLIRLTSADSAVFNSATTPTDLRFAKGSNLNVAFPYQVERWDATDKLAEVWVLVDTVFPGSQQSLRMYWGNATATAASNGAAVFNPANGFVAVWHLQDLTDATGNGYTLSNNAGATKSAGVIDSGYTFVGASKQYLYVKSLLGTPATTTISCWGNVTGTNANTAQAGQELISMGDNNDIRGGNGTTNQAFFNANDGSWPTWSGGTSTSGAGWIYEASVIDPTNSFEAFYQNGVSVGTLSSPGNASGIKYTNGLTQTDIGEDAKTNSTNYLTGSVTEVRIESVARSADWVTLCYANQQAAQTFIGPIVAPTVPVLASPTNGATNQLLAPNLTWNSVSAATSYAVMVSTSSAFGTTILSQSGITAPSVTLSALANSTTYYWQVSATNLTLTSAWSSVWSFTTSAIPLPIAPMLSSPTNGAANMAVALTLAWNTVYIATSYGVQVSTSSAFGSTVFAQSGTTASTAAVSGLANSATYYWRANAANVSGNGPWSAVWNFGTIVATAAAPVLSSPAAGAANVAPSLTLNWGSSANDVSYAIQVSTSSTFGTTVLSQTGLTVTSVPLASLKLGATYYWEVAGSNGAGQGPWSAPWSFSIVTTSVKSAAMSIAAKDGFAVRGSSLEYTLVTPGAVAITFCDILGRTALAVNRTQATGHYAIDLRSYNLAAGQYLITFKSAGLEQRSSVMITK